MDIQRVDELQELITHNLDGSGIRAQPKARVLELVARLAEGARQCASPFVAGDIGQRRIEPVAGISTAPGSINLVGKQGEPVHIPRSAAQSEAVISSSQGKHITEIVGSGTPTPAAE